jgi:hypothetical protein
MVDGAGRLDELSRQQDIRVVSMRVIVTVE